MTSNEGTYVTRVVNRLSDASKIQLIKIEPRNEIFRHYSISKSSAIIFHALEFTHSFIHSCLTSNKIRLFLPLLNNEFANRKKIDCFSRLDFLPLEGEMHIRVLPLGNLYSSDVERVLSIKARDDVVYIRFPAKSFFLSFFWRLSLIICSTAVQQRTYFAQIFLPIHMFWDSRRMMTAILLTG